MVSTAISVALLAILVNAITAANRGPREVDQAQKTGQWWVPGHERLLYKNLALTAFGLILQLMLPTSISWINQIPEVINTVSLILLVTSGIAYLAHYRLILSHQSPSDGTRQDIEPGEQWVINCGYIVAILFGVAVLLRTIKV